jgi:hypothetical protein
VIDEEHTFYRSFHDGSQESLACRSLVPTRHSCFGDGAAKGQTARGVPIVTDGGETFFSIFEIFKEFFDERKSINSKYIALFANV